MNDNKIIIKQFTKEMLDQVLFLENSLFPRPYTLSQLSAEITKKHSVCFTALCNNIICGYLIASLLGTEAELYRIAVKTQYQHKGVASTLLDGLNRICIQNNIYSIFLEVHENNDPAIRSYIKNGFTVTGKRRNYYPDGDALIMIKTITDNGIK